MTLQHPGHLVPAARSQDNVHLAGSSTTPIDFDPEKNNSQINSSEAIHVVENDAGQEADGNSFKQEGVKKVEAVTQIWNKKTLFLIFYIVAVVDMLVVSTQANLDAYVTSEFARHGLIGTISIVSSLLGGCSALTISKIIDVWGRIEGFLCMMGLVAIGMLMKALCRNVETYAAAHTFYWVGHLGLLYVIDVMLADMTSLRNRMLILTLNGTPTIASSFAGPRIAQLFYEESHFRWAFGAFGIILVGVCLPAALVMFFYQRKAYQMGAIQKKTSDRKWWQSIYYYVLQFDVLGIILITAGFALILLPFSLAPRQTRGWADPGMIVMIVMGVVSLVLFVVWERWLAPVQFMPFEYLKDRTIIGACLVYGLMFISIFIWDTYYFSYLQVVHRQSITHAGYILNSFSLMSSFISPFIGVLISYTGDYKWTGLAGVPFMALGTGLLVYFRQPHNHVGLLVMCQLLNGIGSALFATCAQLGVMAAVPHQQIATAIALWGMFGGIGASIGVAIAGALWNNIIPQRLYELLPDSAKGQFAEIYGDMVLQMSFPDGDPIREAIVGAYADVQRRMAIAGACFMPALFVCVFIWRNVNVKKLERERGTQTKGTIF
ncbi:MFS general substrate transporter [Sodiomyces alkalinus F11]|uniref:MFS general substrate transporter n=1 Tax=Sodiomyces alkalinus (strain CBS 110278 / VKM F-3762 / F11) TaxID=1314773 RepID=A0A3N2PUN0_SODAK|nr:MFS general substrate transporter [Sodiomyces alkalinus F11]ROT38215.1 MFS general substrate transporter [Sodiomyces alkalinus F11]